MIAPFPFDALPRVPRAELGFANALARWLGAHGRVGRRVEALVGGAVRVVGGELVEEDRHAGPRGSHDPYAASCELRVGGAVLEVRGASAIVRAIAQRVLGGPAELAAPRPLGAVEHAIWALVVAAAVEDAGIAGEVWPCEESPPIADAREVVLTCALAGSTAATPFTVAIRAPRGLELRVPPARVPAWPATVIVDVPVILGRCALDRASLGRLAVRSVVTLDRPAGPTGELVVLGGTVGVSMTPGEVVAGVTNGYVPRAMALPDDAHVELSVGLGTTQLSLRQVFDLAVGQVVPLGRPLAGPFEVRAAGKLVGQGELVSVDGELGVRIVSLQE